MLRFALIALIAVIVLLFSVSLLPKQQRTIPNSSIELENAQVILYPQEDPEAVWFFASPEVTYNPDLRETTLKNIEDGKRSVNEEIDFTLQAEEVTISSDDNLRGDHLFVNIIEDDIDLDMSAKDNRQVLINQREGKFEIPRVELTQDNDKSIYENMRISFDLNSFESGGEGTVGYSEFEIEDRKED